LPDLKKGLLNTQINNKAPYIPKNWETVACPFCGTKEHSLYERFGSELQYSYVKCSNCGLVYTNPRPAYDQDFIDAAYASYYQYADNISLEDLNHVNESSLKMFELEVDHLVRYDKERAGVLDIGSGMGTFLLAAKKYYGENSEGLDVSVKMGEFVEKNIGVKVHIAQFEEFNPGKKFSLIHMSHVLEHVPDPNKWLQHARELLTPNGILVINVPNKFSIGNRMQHLFYRLRLKQQFANGWKDPSRTPDHLFEPTLKSMRYLLDRNDYDILEHYTYSRRDPVSNSSVFSKLMNRWIKRGSNLAFITRPKK
jgi:2-polyprenyl-3-methyl-5-hydroxy-6-metoxy-1,4-benzoquinol methylase